MTLSEIYEKFIQEKKLSGLADASLKDYYFHLKGFLSYVGNATDMGSLAFSTVQAYIKTLHDSQLSKSSIATYIRNVRIFLTYAETLVPLTFSPSKIKVPKSPKKKVSIYSNDEIRAMFWAISASLPWIVARNRAVVALMLDSGMRQNEVCTLLLRNVSFDSGHIKVHGKGNKERFVPLGRLSAHYLKEYLRLCPYPIKDNLFLSENGGALTGNAVRLFISKLAAKLPFDLSSHKLRHNFATNYCMDKIASGGQVDALSLQLLMGHESLSTTRGYIHCAMELLAVKSSISHLDMISDLP